MIRIELDRDAVIAIATAILTFVLLDILRLGLLAWWHGVREA